jgi:catechol 2,3-dioxygenase-like lactoylglutathione lyase family enzyme
MEDDMAGNNNPKFVKAHVALNVRDIEQSTDFYKKMFGIDPVKIRPGYVKFDVQNPPLNLSLNAGHPRSHGALSHLGLQVVGTDDVIVVRDRWSASGLPVRSEMHTECCYALQDKAWVGDPDGNEWEVFTVVANIEQSGEACCQPGVPCETLVQMQEVASSLTD